ncbi:MAG: peptidoglycan recognition protein family protein [Acidimicrobiia bacterium]
MRFRSLLALMLTATALAMPAAQSRAGTGTQLVTLPAGRMPQPTPFPLSHVGVQWRGSEAAVVEVRTGRPGSLGPWRPLAVAHDLEDEEAAIHRSGLLRADGATLVQARVQGKARAVEIVAIDATTSTPPPTRVSEPLPGQPEVLSRPAWGADEGMRKGAPEFAPPTKLVVHHTVTPNDDPDPASTVRAIYAYHTQQNGWNDIGYNFLVDATGRVYEGRYARPYGPGEVPTGEDPEGRGVVGAHARGFNAGSVGVALLGEFSGGAQPSGAALDSLVRLLAWKADRHGIDPHGADAYTRTNGSQVAFPNLSGHRDVGQTACPGDRLHERLPEIRDRVAATMRPAPSPPLPPPAPVPPVPGFWTALASGQVLAHGDAPHAGDLSGVELAAPVVALAARPGGGGYWLAAGDGGVFAFGDAPFLGAATGALAAPAVQLEPTPSGLGYWVVSSAGEVVAFGDARFLGSTAPPAVGAAPAPPVVEIAGLAATPTGAGYWLAATDGRVFAFGDALPRGATPGQAVTGAAGEVHPAAPIVAIAGHPDGRGYWLLGSDGGVFAIGTGFFGSRGGERPARDAVQLRVTATGEGYYVAGGDGTVYAFGDADRRRELPGGNPGVVDLALWTVPAS